MNPTPSHLLPLLALLGSTCLLASCGGRVGEAIRPSEHTALQALGKEPVACAAEPAYARPLIVDLDSDARLDLEAAMQDGVVVVRYDCKSLRVLSQCHAPQTIYSYAGVSRREQVVKIESGDELSANFPLGQAKLGAEIASGRSIDLGLVTVGRNSTTITALAPDELKGPCEGATHFVQNATLGAFAMVTGSTGKAMAVAEIFGYGGSAGSHSNRSSVTADGSLEACRGSAPRGSAPPDECGAPLRIELVPIANKSRSTATTKDEAPLPVAQQNPCPAGFRYVDGMCTRDAAGPHLCAPDDEADCKAQCNGGSAESCYNFAVLLHRAKRGDDAVPFYQQACEGEVADACAAYARLATSVDEGPEALALNRKVFTVAEHGCELGSGNACTTGGDLQSEKEWKMLDLPRAATLYEQGCKLGDASACFSLAEMRFRGQGGAKDSAAAMSALRRACVGGDGSVCYELAKVLENGKYGVAKDPEAGLTAMASACRADPDFCIDAAQSATKLGRFDEALGHARHGCDHDDDAACLRLGDMYRDGKGTTTDLAKAKTSWAHACRNGEEDGDATACKRLGIPMKG